MAPLWLQEVRGETMRECVGDLFVYPADALVIPVNWTANRNGDAVMGAGVAKQAADRRPDLPFRLGQVISDFPDDPHVCTFAAWPGKKLITFPTKRHWRNRSDINLISSMAEQLLEDAAGMLTIALPRLGCGRGGLSWDQVRPILERYLDDRFVALTQPCPTAPDAG